MPTRKTAQKKNGKNDQTPLETATEALVQSTATLIQNMATLVQNQTLFNQQIAQINADIRQINAETREIERANAERFLRIEQLLLRHELMLQELPEAIRQKIGFQKP
jgi:hypothetical protein